MDEANRTNRKDRQNCAGGGVDEIRQILTNEKMRNETQSIVYNLTLNGDTLCVYYLKL